MKRSVPAPAGALLLVLSSYAVAGVAARLVLHAVPTWHPVAQFALADFVATVVIFAYSRFFDNSSFYDPYWTVAPAVTAVWMAVGPGTGGNATRQLLVIVFVGLWALRLTANWVRSWEGMKHEDWRYVDFRAQWGRWYWLGSFAAIHLFPTIMTFAGSLPMWPATSSKAPLGPLDFVAVAVTCGATLLQGIADEQMRRFRADQAAKGESGAICEVGLWRWSRHPNYFGECLFWVGVWLFGVAADPGSAWWTSVGFVAILAMFVFGTIPLMEKRSLRRRPSYASTQRRISMLVPWPPRSDDQLAQASTDGERK